MLKGKRDKYTTIISIYRPSIYQATYLRQTAYTAKRRKISPDHSPNDLWYIDLRDVIQEKISQGHEVIVAGDFNDDLNDDNGKTRQFMHKLGLREVMLEKYGSGPATHVRGTKTIDGIFATRQIHIAQGYYLPFDKSPSDHRWIIVDIDEELIIGSSRDDLCPPLLRKATSKIPSVKYSFQNLLEQQVKLYNLRERLHQLFKEIQDGNPFTATQVRVYESIEERMQRAVKYADSRCRKVRRGVVPFSPTQRKLMGTIIVLKQIQLRHKLKGKPNRPRTKKIQRLIAKYGYTGLRHFQDQNEIEEAIRTAIIKYNEFKGTAKSQRWAYLEQLATELDEQDGRGVNHHYKILYNREQTREYFRRIRACEGKNKGGGVDRIQIGDTDPPQITYDKNQIEQEIMRANEAKLLQASDTPLRDPNISVLLGEQGDFSTWEQILQGTINLPDGVDEGLLLWYNYVRSIPKHTPLDFTWSPQEYFDSWSKMKEDKMTIPGIQVAHIKCIDAATDSAYVISTLALWRIGIDSMIPKKVADLRPEKLRLILLMDARFNHNNKLIGKKMMEYGELHGLLAPEQFGSRKSKLAMEHATNKRVVMDIIRQSCTNGIYVANDAKSCYDNILLIVAYLTMRQFGVPALVAQSTISTILRMQHFVRTKYGDSLQYYGGDKWATLPHGCGQGNGYGPALWACISSPLLHLLRQHGYGTRLQFPISDTNLHIAAFAFVHDVDMIQTSNYCDNASSDVPSLYSKTQQALDQWASTLRATGGELEPTKTFYVPIITEWKGQHKTVVMPKETREIHLKTIDGSTKNLSQHKPTESFFTLGIWHSPTGDENKQLEYMISKIQDWGEQTDIHKLTWAQTRIAIRSMIGKTLQYPLPATTFTDTQLKNLQKKILHTVLGKMGIVRSAPATIATAPTQLGGLGVLSFEFSQLIGHINLLLTHGPDKTSLTGQLLKLSLEYYAIESGLPGDPLRLPSVDYVTSDTWIGQTIYMLRKYDIDIESDVPGLVAWREGDVFIMEKMMLFFSGSTLAIINKVRMYLKVATLSDLLVADGTSFSPELVQGHRNYLNPTPSAFRYNWPQVPTPTRSERETWWHGILLIFDISLTLSRTIPPTTDEWNASTNQYSCWLFSPNEQAIYERLNTSTWLKWVKNGTESACYETRSSLGSFSQLQTVSEIPNDTLIISISRTGERIRILRKQATITANTTHEQTTDSNSTYTISCATSYFLYHIQLHNGIIVSDGSYRDGRPTFAFLAQPQQLDCEFHNLLWDTFSYGIGHVDGSEDDSNAYRAELAGILAAINYTNEVCKSANVLSGTCTLYCDNKGALSASFGHKRPHPRWSSYDIVWKIRQALKQSKIRWKYKHVYGHQDKSKNFHSLDNIAQGNVIVDHLASHYQIEDNTEDNFVKAWTPKMQGTVIGGSVEKQILYKAYKPLMIARWKQLFRINNGREDLDWEMFFRSRRAQRRQFQPFWTKFNARILPVGTNLKRRLHSDSDSCPCCGELESHDHILTCSHPTMETTYQECLLSVQQFVQQNLEETMGKDIITILRYLRYNESPDIASNNMVTQQISLGSRAFFAGLWHVQWRDYHGHYLQRIQSSRNSMVWMIKLVTKIQEFPFELWNTRNKILHQSDNAVTQQQQQELDEMIDILYLKKPHSRFMAHCDNQYFQKHTKDQLKNMTIRRKTNWIAGANLILTKYERTTTVQSVRFKSFFQWDRG